MSAENQDRDRLLTVEELAAKLNLHKDTVAEKSRGRRPTIPAVRIGRAVRYHWPTVAAKLGMVASFLILLSPTSSAANPTFLEPAAPSASRSAAGEPLSAKRVPAGGVSRMPGVTPQPLPARAGAPVLAPSSFSAVRRDHSGGSPKPRVGQGTGGIPSWASSTGGALPNNLGPVTPPAPPSFHAGGGRWYGIDLRKLAHAESQSRDGAVGASGERGRLQITRAALVDVNKGRATKVRFASLTNAETSAAVARAYITILAGRIRRAGAEPTPAAILCAWNDGLSDARRYGFDPDRAPYPTRRLIAAQ